MLGRWVPRSQDGWEEDFRITLGTRVLLLG